MTTTKPEPIHTDRLVLLPLAVEHAETMAAAWRGSSAVNG